jgi:outer membrane protein assembly factor BamB
MRGALLATLALLAVPAGAAASDLPVPATAPWPEMRHDAHNTGAADIAGRYLKGRKPWSFKTGKGIFSTPTVGPGNVVYVGSGDGVFHALSPRGRSLWSFRTNGVIDSSGVLTSDGVTVGSGDEYLYRLRTRRKTRRRVIWKLKAQQPSGTAQLVDWWEGNAEVGPDGTVYAGNTGSAAYAIHPDGKVKWIFRGGNSFWTDAPIAADGTTFWGSLDLFVYALDKDGKQLWRTPTLGFVISSPALSRDESTIYVGSFDGKLHALDAKTGLEKWSFQTGDHVYSSPALDEDASGNLRAIYFASADGSVYALRPDGTKIWQYDTGDAVRSSPVIGLAPDGTSKIVYVGSANGSLYALNAADGTRRWSFDTTPRSAALRDRNDLNASPALSTTGVYIGSESGELWYVPYDWCLRGGLRDPRCDRDPGQAFGQSLTRVFPVTFGGTTAPPGYQSALPAATTLIGRLVVHRGAQTIDASMQPIPSAKSLVTADPPFDFTAGLSGDGHFIFVEPTGILQPDSDYTLRFSGLYTDGGVHLGNAVVGGTNVTQFGDGFRFHTEPAGGPLPLHTGPAAVSAFRVRRLAVPLPAFLPSVNQIGFDSYEWLAGVVAVGAPGSDGRGSLLVWVIGIKRDARGRWVPDPKSGFAFPLSGIYLRDLVSLGLQNMPLTFSFGTVPLDVLNFRGRLRRDMTMDGPNLYAEATCAKVPNYGPFLGITRLCNDQGKIISSGTYLTQAYARRGSANRRPRGVAVTDVALDPPTATAHGHAVAQLAASRYLAAAHTLAILLVDAATGRPLPLDYGHTTTVAADPAGNAKTVTLDIPAGTSMPEHVRAYVMTDVFPLAARDF